MAFDRHYTMNDLLEKHGYGTPGRKSPPAEQKKTVAKEVDNFIYGTSGRKSPPAEQTKTVAKEVDNFIRHARDRAGAETAAGVKEDGALRNETMDLVAKGKNVLAEKKKADDSGGKDNSVLQQDLYMQNTNDFLSKVRERRENMKNTFGWKTKPKHTESPQGLTTEGEDPLVKHTEAPQGLTTEGEDPLVKDANEALDPLNEETRGDMPGGRSPVRTAEGGDYVGDPFNDPIGGYDEREIGIIAPRPGNSPELAAQFPALGAGQMLGWTGEDTEEVMNIPEGAYVVGNRVMVNNNRRQRSILDNLSGQAKDAYDAIQFKSVEEDGRLTDRDTAKIRAMWQVGDISRERALAMARGLRELRAPGGKPMKLRERTGETMDVPVFDPSSYGEGGGLLDPAEDVIADLPKGSFQKSDGKYYRKAPVIRDNLSLTTRAETDAYGRIRKDFAAANGRDMDRDVAAIRARLAAGTITKTQAKGLAVALRRKRDVALAKETSHDYHVSHGLSPKESDLREDWTRFFVDTGEAGQIVKRDGKRRLLSAMNRSVSSHGEGSDEAKRSMTLARRFGFGSRHEFTPEHEVTPEANIPANYKYNKVLSYLGFRPGGYWAAARRNAEAVIADVNDRERDRQPLSSNDRRRRANAVDALLNNPHIRNADSNDFSGFKLGTDPKRFKRMNRRFVEFIMPEDK